MLITDPLNNRLLEVNRNGQVLRTIEGQRSGRFARPGGIDVGPDGNIYIVDGTLGTVQTFTPDGVLIEALPFTARPADPIRSAIDIAVDSDGGIYFATLDPPSNEGFRKLDPDGNETVVKVDTIQEPESAFIFASNSVAIGPDGLIYLGMGPIAQVRAYTDEGETVVRWPEEPDRLDQVYQVAAGPDGVFAVLGRSVDGQKALVLERVDDSEDVIATFQGDQSGEPLLPDAINALPLDVDVARDGSFFVLDLLTQNVLHLSPDGQEIGWLDLGDDGADLALRSIAVDDDQRIYLADVNNRQILVYEPVAE